MSVPTLNCSPLGAVQEECTILPVQIHMVVGACPGIGEEDVVVRVGGSVGSWDISLMAVEFSVTVVRSTTVNTNCRKIQQIALFCDVL